MKPTALIAGRQYHSHGVFGAPKVYTFLCRGMNGPTDAGITHLSDYQVCKNIQPIPSQPSRPSRDNKRSGR